MIHTKFKYKKQILLASVVLLIAGVFLFKNNEGQNTNPNAIQEDIQEEVKSFFAINGEKATEEISHLRPSAIIIENHPDSRPQSGLSLADIVYEVMAEGGITRFLALYQTLSVEDKTNLGPVRSAREYFAQIANDWQAIFFHVGGSNEVIDQIKKGVYPNLYDVNEYFNDKFYIYKSKSLAPHHIFTNREQIQKAGEFHKYFNLPYEPEQNFLFKEESKAAVLTATSIDMDFSRAGYEVGWRYDLGTNSYKRLMYYEPHMDFETKHQITAKNIVVQVVKVTQVGDDLLSVDIDLTNGGKAFVFRDGEVVEGVWKSVNGQTKYFDSSNKEIQLNRGKIWVEMLPVEKEQSLKWKL